MLKKLLRSFCFQQQKGLFEGELTPAQLKRLKLKIEGIIDVGEDCVVVYPLAKQNIFAKIVLGRLPFKISRIF